MNLSTPQKEPIVLPNTAGQDRPIERLSLWRRHRKLAAGASALLIAACVFGGYWLSVRGKDPYAAPGGGLIAVIAVLVAVNIGWSAWVIKRAGAGVSGPAQRKRRTWLSIVLVVWIVASAVTVPLYHVQAHYPAWGLYPANAPLLIDYLNGLPAIITGTFFSGMR